MQNKNRNSCLKVSALAAPCLTPAERTYESGEPTKEKATAATALRRRFSLRGRVFALTALALLAATLSGVAKEHQTGFNNKSAQPNPVNQGHYVTLSVQLVDNALNKAPIVGEPIEFQVKWTHESSFTRVGTKTTDSRGYATFIAPVPNDVVPKGLQKIVRPFNMEYKGKFGVYGKHESGGTFTVVR